MKKKKNMILYSPFVANGCKIIIRSIVMKNKFNRYILFAIKTKRSSRKVLLSVLFAGIQIQNNFMR